MSEANGVTPFSAAEPQTGRGHEGKLQAASSPTCVQMSSARVPTPYYTLINTSRGDDPAVVVVNSALRTFDDRASFPWHLKLTIDCKSLGTNGMPTAEEGDVLNRLEDEISIPLTGSNNAMFLARITCQGQRELLYRVHDPEAADKVLQEFVSAPHSVREWGYRMEHDADWELAQPELGLLERDPGIN